MWRGRRKNRSGRFGEGQDIMRFELMALMPCLAIIVSALPVRRGPRTWMSSIVVGTSLAIAISELRLGIAQSCGINESECVGAEATSYLVLALWTPFVVGFVGRMIIVNRAMR